MKSATYAALAALAGALLKDPEAIAEIQDYGSFPEHLADLIDDFDPTRDD